MKLRYLITTIDLLKVESISHLRGMLEHANDDEDITEEDFIEALETQVRVWFEDGSYATVKVLDIAKGYAYFWNFVGEHRGELVSADVI